MRDSAHVREEMMMMVRVSNSHALTRSKVRPFLSRQNFTVEMYGEISLHDVMHLMVRDGTQWLHAVRQLSTKII
jgi:hypothetical protein